MFLGEWCNVAISYYVQFFPNPDQFLVVVEDGVFIFQLLFCINFCVIWCDADPWFCGSVSNPAFGVSSTASVCVRYPWNEPV